MGISLFGSFDHGEGDADGMCVCIVTGLLDILDGTSVAVAGGVNDGSGYVPDGGSLMGSPVVGYSVSVGFSVPPSSEGGRGG